MGVKSQGRVVVPEDAVDAARRDMIADRTSDSQTRELIRQYCDAKDSKYGSYVADPHTAVALSVAHRIQSQSPSTVTQVVLATAHPAKFSEAVTSSLESAGAGFNFERDVLPKEFEGLLERERRVFSSKASPEAVKAVIEEHVGHLVQAKA